MSNLFVSDRPSQVDLERYSCSTYGSTMLNLPAAGRLRAHPTMSTKRTSKKLQYPLTERALQAAFELLQPESIYVSRQGAEATIDGAWSLSTLRRHFAELEFVAIGHPDSLLFVNQQRTIGFQCQGVDADPKKNTWKTYCVEVQSRSPEEAQRLRPLERHSTTAPGAFPSQSNLFGL